MTAEGVEIMECRRSMTAATERAKWVPNITEVPVLIVGGGAAGCVLSMELARRGVEYRCIERMPGPGRESRAIAMHARTIELFDLVDEGTPVVIEA